MALPFKIQQLLVSDEASFAENAESGTPTWSKNLPVLDATLTLNHERVPDAGIQGRMEERVPGHASVRTAQLKFKTYWPGHNTTTSGALTESWAQQLLGDGLGGNDLTQVGAILTGAPTSAVVSATAATFTAGSIIRVGTKGDSRADGSAGVVSSVSGTTATLLNSLAGTPTTADTAYATAVAFVDEGAAAITKRFMLLHQTANLQHVIFGAQLAGLSFDCTPGKLPTIDWTYEGAYWRRVARTFPDSTTLQNALCAPVAGGSFYIQDVGTTTRATITPAEINLTVSTGITPIVGPGGVGTYQHITGWQRTMFNADLEVKIPWETTYETWWDTANQSLTYKHILFTANHTDGRAVGFYMPRVFPGGQRPSGGVAVNDQNYVSVVFHSRIGPDTTNDLTRSAVRFFNG